MPVDCICAHCHRSYAAPPSFAKRSKYCGRACYLAAQGTPRERYRRNVEQADGCWNWTGPMTAQGYGQFFANGKNEHAHRWAYRLAYGAIPPGMFVCHHCDNRRCVRPDHLFLGDALANNRDKIAKGRDPRGETHGRAKLTDDAVRAIRASPQTGQQLAQQYGVDRSAISAVRRHDTWKHV